MLEVSKKQLSAIEEEIAKEALQKAYKREISALFFQL